MATCALDLPINIPWKLIAASADMMDTRFCNKLFPFAWRSSLALSVYEPDLDDLPDGLCGQRLTYLKLTCSITGYQPSKEETGQIVDYFGDTPTEDQRAVLERILAEYFACYGVLLNAAVFPGPRKVWKEVPFDFANRPDAHADGVEPNPWVIGGTKFEATGQASNMLVDLVPTGGDGQKELDLTKELVVTLPPGENVGKIEAQVAHSTVAGMRMEVFKAGVLLGSKVAGPEHTIQTLVIEADGIDRVVFTAPEGGAQLLTFKYGMPAGTSVDTSGISLDDFPHFIDFEPKLRDLYQAATDTGEVLSDSKSGIKTDKSFTHTESTQSSLSLGAKVPIPSTPVVGEISTTRTNTDADQTQWAVAADASRERRETQSTSTQISQMYNLLTGYHVGTNRAVFLMLARPHVLQPTDFRTFVQGLRAIEGVQEFFLIVSRPKDMDAICVEASLETGHFPENAPIVEPKPEFEESFEDFPVVKTASSGLFDRSCTDLETSYTIGTGWIIDRRPERGADPGHPGMQMIDDRSNDQAKDSLHDYNYLPTSDVSVTVSGEICGRRAPFSTDPKFDRLYRVFTRSEQPKPSHAQPAADVGRLVITARELCVCFRSRNACPEIVPRPGHRALAPEKAVVAEPKLRVNRALIDAAARKNTRTPAMKEFLRQVEHALASSWRLPNRYPPGEFGFLDTEYFKDQIVAALMPDVLRAPLRSVDGMPPRLAAALGGEKATLGDALAMELGNLARAGGLSIEEARDLRQRVLRAAMRPGDIR